MNELKLPEPYPPLPPCEAIHAFMSVYTADQMRAYVNADRAQQAERHAEELLAYEVMVGNLRTQRVPDAKPRRLTPQEVTLCHSCAVLAKKHDGTDPSFTTLLAKEIMDAMLSAAPAPEPERKPMTDGEKLYAMWHSSDANDLDDFLDGWRHAEAFHGIGEKP